MGRGVNGAKCDAWRRRLAKFNASGLTVVDFCRREHVSQGSFYYWSKRIPGRSTSGERQRCDVGTKASRNEQASDVVEVIVDDSIRVRMPAQPAAVAALIQQLQKTQRIDASSTTSRFQRIELL